MSIFVYDSILNYHRDRYDVKLEIGDFVITSETTRHNICEVGVVKRFTEKGVIIIRPIRKYLHSVDDMKNWPLKAFLEEDYIKFDAYTVIKIEDISDPIMSDIIHKIREYIL